MQFLSNCFGLISSKPMFSYFCEIQKEKTYRLKWIIYKQKSDKNQKCLSIDNFKGLSADVKGCPKL